MTICDKIRDSLFVILRAVYPNTYVYFDIFYYDTLNIFLNIL